MPSLKDIRNRITSVRSTQKITSAMKLVAASKLRRAQEQAEAARPYAERMGRMLASLAANVQPGPDTPKLMTGTGDDRVHLVVIISSDRGLAGAFNSSIVREARRTVERLLSEGRDVKILCVGRKGRDLMRRTYGNRVIQSFEEVGKRRLSFSEADKIANRVLELFAEGQFDVATVIYNRFKSAIAQIVTLQQVIPFAPEETQAAAEGQTGPKALYEFEPGEEQILADLLPRNVAVQLYRALLESAASEQGARMTAMDNATRNAGDMIKRLTLVYNRTRQANITKELIEIISGAEAV